MPRIFGALVPIVPTTKMLRAMRKLPINACLNGTGADG